MPIKTLFPEHPRAHCEALLRVERQDLIDKAIWPSIVVVIDRLLRRGLELNEAYEELFEKLHDRPHALKTFFDQLCSIAALWHPEANLEARQGRARLTEVNRRIEDVASELAQLLSERTHLRNHSGFSFDTFFHPLDVIHAAAQSNLSYGRWVKEKLDAIRHQFDLKYWPSLDNLAQAIADDAGRAEPQAHDAVTDAGTEGARAGLADTFKAFYVALEDSRARNHGFLPNAIELTDRSTAILMSCALGLDADQTVGAEFVKRLRQRERAKGRHL